MAMDGDGNDEVLPCAGPGEDDEGDDSRVNGNLHRGVPAPVAVPAPPPVLPLPLLLALCDSGVGSVGLLENGTPVQEGGDDDEEAEAEAVVSSV